MQAHLALGVLVLAGACRTPDNGTRGAFRVAGEGVERRVLLVDGAKGRVVSEPSGPSRAIQEALQPLLAYEGSLEQSPLEGFEPRSVAAVELFRQGSWRLAEAWFNGALSDADYTRLMAELLEACFLQLPPGPASEPPPPACDTPSDDPQEVPVRTVLGWIG